jgi:hypothetical protein
MSVLRDVEKVVRRAFLLVLPVGLLVCSLVVLLLTVLLMLVLWLVLFALVQPWVPAGLLASLMLILNSIGKTRPGRRKEMMVGLN